MVESEADNGGKGHKAAEMEPTNEVAVSTAKDKATEAAINPNHRKGVPPENEATEVILSDVKIDTPENSQHRDGLEHPPDNESVGQDSTNETGSQVWLDEPDEPENGGSAGYDDAEGDAEADEGSKPETVPKTEASIEEIMASCKAGLGGLQDLLLRMRAVPDAYRVLPVQNGVDYLLETPCTAQILQLVDSLPSGITADDQDVLISTLAVCNLHLKACGADVEEAEATNSWTVPLSRHLDVSWKNFCLQMMNVPDLLHLTPLNLSLLIGNTIIDKPKGVQGSERTYSSIDTHMRRLRNRRQRKLNPTIAINTAADPRNADVALVSPLAPSIPESDNEKKYEDEAYDEREYDDSIYAGPPGQRQRSRREPPPSYKGAYERSQRASVTSRRAKGDDPPGNHERESLQGAYDANFHSVAVFTGHIYGPITISGLPPPFPAQSAGVHSPPLPPPPPDQSRPPAVRPLHFATAIYDYEAQRAGDISFKVGDKVLVLEMTPDTNAWWLGVCIDGVQGYFPANYVTFDQHPPTCEVCQEPAAENVNDPGAPVSGRANDPFANVRSANDPLTNAPLTNAPLIARDGIHQVWTYREWVNIIKRGVLIWVSAVISTTIGIAAVRYLDDSLQRYLGRK